MCLSMTTPHNVAHDLSVLSASEIPISVHDACYIYALKFSIKFKASSFVAAGAPAFSLSSTSWDYGSYTWHTNKDTYDKAQDPLAQINNKLLFERKMAFPDAHSP